MANQPDDFDLAYASRNFTRQATAGCTGGVLTPAERAAGYVPALDEAEQSPKTKRTSALYQNFWTLEHELIVLLGFQGHDDVEIAALTVSEKRPEGYSVKTVQRVLQSDYGQQRLNEMRKALESGTFDTRVVVRLQHQLLAPEATKLLGEVMRGTRTVSKERLEAVKLILRNAGHGVAGAEHVRNGAGVAPRDEFSGKSPEQIRALLAAKAAAAESRARETAAPADDEDAGTRH